MKYQEINILSKKISKFKKKGKKIILCHGVFDLVHIGHIKYLRAAKKLGDILVVSITNDKFVNKGPGSPYFKVKERIEFLTSLDFVDFICTSNNFESIDVINKIKPNYYCKGKDYSLSKNKLTKEFLLLVLSK